MPGGSRRRVLFIMNLETFAKRFDLSMTAHKEFIDDMKAIDDRLDCVFNRLEQCWMIIIWNTPLEWNWVMSLRDHETEERYLPCQFVIDRLHELRAKWSSGQIIKEIEKAEADQKAARDSDIESWAHELAKDLRKPLINDMDGVVSSRNVFQVL